MPHLLIGLFLLPLTSQASWQMESSHGQEDGLGLILFFYAFLVFVIVRDGFKESRSKGYKCLAACLLVGWLIATYKWALVVASLIFLVSFLMFCWEKLK